VIIGVTAAVAMPAMRRFGQPTGTPAIEGAQNVLQLLRSARATAMDRGQEVTVRIDPTSGAYEVHSVDGEKVGEMATGHLSMPEGARLVEREDPLFISFGPLGRAVGPDVVVSGPDGSIEVELDTWTGQPRIVETPRNGTS
jgi:hypothetical protein